MITLCLSGKLVTPHRLKSPVDLQMNGFFVVAHGDNPFFGLINHTSPAAEVKIGRLTTGTEFFITGMNIA